MLHQVSSGKDGAKSGEIIDSPSNPLPYYAVQVAVPYSNQ